MDSVALDGREKMREPPGAWVCISPPVCEELYGRCLTTLWTLEV